MMECPSVHTDSTIMLGYTHLLHTPSTMYLVVNHTHVNVYHNTHGNHIYCIHKMTCMHTYLIQVHTYRYVILERRQEMFHAKRTLLFQ